jgi:N-acyl-D-aspartate/D-glutamate deacylase
MLDLVISGGLVVDGTGAPARPADVGIRGDRVVAVGDLASATAADRLDAAGLLVCPGFVDLHSHSDLTLLSGPHARSKVRQGVTTEVTGNCGMSPAPSPGGAGGAGERVRRAVALIDLDPAVSWGWEDMAGYRDALAAARPALNVAPLCGHVALRTAVAGDAGGVLDTGTIGRIERAAEEALEQGAAGLSTGLMYPPARFADESELTALGRVAARRGALLAVHMRDYSDRLLPAVEEALAVARATGCRLQVSHLAVAGKRNWGSVGQALELVDGARAEGLDVGVDIYPYLAGSANLSQLLPGWAQEGGSGAMLERLADSVTRARIRNEWEAALHLGWDEIVISLVDGPLTEAALGRTVAQTAETLGTSPDELALDLITSTVDGVQMVAFGRSAGDLEAVLRHPAAVIGSDGLALDPAGPTGRGRPHPRSYGCYPRLLGRVVREQRLLPLERAVAMATSMPARRAGLAGRGVVSEAAYADLVVLDAEQVVDLATFEDPATFPAGIRDVIVNGVPVVRGGIQHDDARPGRVLSRQG